MHNLSEGSWRAARGLRLQAADPWLWYGVRREHPSPVGA